MAGTCGAILAKVILIILNVLFFCAGVVLICVGGWIVGSPQVTEPVKILEGTFGSQFLRNSGILLITMGVVIIFVTALGFFAAITENTIALVVYLALLVVILIGVMSGGAVAIVFKDKIIESLGEHLKTSLTNLATETNETYYEGTTEKKCNSNDRAHAWDYVQDTFECCGVQGSSDYGTYFEFDLKGSCGLDNCPNVYAPITCYKRVSESISLSKELKDYAGRYNCSDEHKKGCIDGMVTFVNKYAPALIGIGLGFGFLQLFGIIFTVCLCQNPDI